MEGTQKADEELLRYLSGEISFDAWLEKQDIPRNAAQQQETLHDEPIVSDDQQNYFEEDSTIFTSWGNIFTSSSAASNLQKSIVDMDDVESDDTENSVRNLSMDEETEELIDPLPSRNNPTVPNVLENKYRLPSFANVPEYNEKEAVVQGYHIIPIIEKLHPILKDSTVREIPMLESKSKKNQVEELPDIVKDFQAFQLKKYAAKSRRKLPDLLRMQMGQANLLCAKGDFKQAADICMQVVREAPSSGQPFKTLAFIYEEQGDKEMSLQYSLISAFLDCKDANEWMELAKKCSDAGNMKQTLVCYDRACKYNTSDLALQWERSVLYFENMDYRKCLDIYQIISKLLIPSDRQVYIEVARSIAKVYHEFGMADKAAETIEAALVVCPGLQDVEGKESVNKIDKLSIYSVTCYLKENNTENVSRDVENTINFYDEGCGCSRSCVKQFSLSYVNETVIQCKEMTRELLDVLILGQLLALMSFPKNSQSNTVYRHRNLVVCRKTFCFLHNIGKHRLENIMQHYENNGVVERSHGNKSRVPCNATNEGTVTQVKSYIENHSSIYGLSLPGRTPSHRLVVDDTAFLPSHHSKAFVHRQYVEDCYNQNKLSISYDIFINLWKQFLPNVITISPRNDLCFTCQENNNLIISSANTDNDSKSESLKRQQQHLLDADIQSNDYRHRIFLAKNSYQAAQPDITISSKKPNSVHAISVYSFDFAQSIHYPANPDQPGAIFFKTPRKVGLFGINNESLNRQTNYVIDEAVDRGKGFLHHYLEKYGIGETTAHFQADNCAGQNKNNIMMQYLCWRVLNGFHNKITINFMIAGHTKFSVDRCFGLIKRKYNRMFCSSIFDIAESVNVSSEIGCNVAELVGLPDGKVLVDVFDWSSYLINFFKRIPNISKYHHFRFDKDHPGSVFVRRLSHQQEEKVEMLKPDTTITFHLPDKIKPEGLTYDRRLYLYREIRKFCRPNTEDLVAPMP